MLAMIAVSICMTSCSKEETSIDTPTSAESINEPNVTILSSMLLNPNDSRIISLKTIISSKNTNLDQLDFNNVTFVEYSEDNATALIVPVISDNGLTSKTMIAYYLNGVYDNSMYLEFNPSEEYKINAKENADIDYSGEFNLYSESGQIISKSIYKEGIVIDRIQSIEARGCIYDCLDDAIKSLPWYVQWSCGASLGGCVYAGNPVACGVVAGCVGGAYLHCWLNVC